MFSISSRTSDQDRPSCRQSKKVFIEADVVKKAFPMRSAVTHIHSTDAINVSHSTVVALFSTITANHITTITLSSRGIQ
jgi:hypothetical protein